MLPATKEDKIRLAVAICGLAGLFGVVVWLAQSGALQEHATSLVRLLENKERLRAYLRNWGAFAPIAFMGIQALQVVIAPIPGEVTGIAGGFIFGAFWNVVYSTVGLSVGSAIAFAAARIIGRPFVQLMIRPRTLEKFAHLTERRGIIATLVLFAIPGFPKDVLSYLLGLGPMRFLTFILVCALGRIPGTILLSISGSALYKENWKTLMIVAVLFGILFVISYIKKDSIKKWIGEKSHVRGPEE
jgi:uncharacterized membrane protein YdjX (TVP38/TMEM64 family)